MRIAPLGYFFDARSVPTAVEPAYQKEQLVAALSAPSPAFCCGRGLG